VFSVNVSSEDAEDLVNVNTDAKGSTMPTLEGKGKVLLFLDRLDLKAGKYFVNVGVYEAAWSHAYDYHWHVYPLTVLTGVRQFGLLNVPHRWALEGQ
jgi:lipopolysaccharide transport system ATP-binding protein